MKQNARNLKQQIVYKRRRVALFVALIMLVALLISIYASNTTTTKTVTASIDISKITSTEPNPPAVGAGMIPIKWDGAYWVITASTDNDWYDYSKGKWANVMLSDGYYKSEIEAGINEEKQLASNNIGAQINDEAKMGTIYTWVPRLCYNDTQIEFLKGASIVEYGWTTQSCFNLEKSGANALNLAYEGIWVGQKEYESATEVENKNTEMRTKDNKQGIIANEQVKTLTDSDKIAVKKLYEKYNGISENETTIKNIDSMLNRQTIKIVNTNKNVPLVGAHKIQGKNILVTTKYSEYGVKEVLDEEGNVVVGGVYRTNEEDTQYVFYIIDNMGNVIRYSVSYGTADPDLRNFSKSNTFYVTYDENGNENSGIPIGEEAPEDWYNYDNQQWANIVVRNGGNEIYYTWIPRYMYKLNLDGTETVDAKIVDLNNVYVDPETQKETNLTNSDYILPEAFTWEDPSDSNKVVQLRGFWASKYKLREGETYTPEITGGSGVIRVNNVLSHYGTSYTYEMYLIKDGKRMMWDTDKNEYVEGIEAINLTGNYIYQNVPEGEYVVNIIVKNSSGEYVRAIANQITVRERVEPNVPDLTGFNKNLTYYVKYDENGFEESSTPIGEEAPENWYNYDNQQWANIVVRENGQENYYVWVPRYEYQLDTSHEKTSVQFISTNQTEADAGYTIPEAFTWEDPSDSNKVIQLNGFWSSKYKLRDDTVYYMSATVTAGETNIKVSTINPKISETPASYEVSLIKDGKIIKTEEITGAEHSFKGLEAGEKYAINLVAKNADGKMLAAYSTEVTLVKIEVDLTGFNKDTTFYVTYDENGNENSEIPIGEEAPEGWYDYAEQKWANVVCRNNGNEIYYVWIPRYEYVTSNTNQTVKAVFIPKTQETADDGYTIPEAFTWEDPNDSSKVVQLSGFWSSKYKLREGETYSPEITGGSGVIRVNNVLSHYGTSYTYEMYLIQNGKRIVQSGTTYVEGTAPITLTGNYTYQNVPAGDYVVNIVVKNSSGSLIRTIAQQVTVQERVEPNVPDLTGFNKNLTYYVVYDELGNEESSTPIGEEAPEDWYNYDNQQWANIVVRENGQESYYVWVPRYEYKLEPANERTSVQFISINQTEADTGYTIPEAFTWEDPTNSNKVIQLSGFWSSKYKLRDDSTRRLDATVAGSEKKIRVSNIVASSSEVQFRAYLIKDGKILQTAAMTKNGEHTFTVSEYGTYSVAIKQWSTTNGTVAGFAKEVVLQEIAPPDVTGFRVDTTYIVTYDDSGNESHTQAIKDVLKEGAVISSDNTLQTGEIDVSKINGTWYDYSEQKWANIVTINDGATNYFTWIPRYEYVLDTSTVGQKVKAILIPKEKETADDGYTIPEAFTWEDPNNSSKVIQLSGFWASKYKLRSN